MNNLRAQLKQLSERETKLQNDEVETDRWLSRDSLKINEKNNYSISEESVRALAEDIALTGLEAPIVVFDNRNGTYTIVSGHRRLAAIDLLIKEGRWDGKIHCSVFDYEKIDLPLSFEGKELYAIIHSNVNQRDKTAADYLFEVSVREKLIDEMRKNGAKTIQGPEGDISLKGKRTRIALAEQMGTSTGQVGKAMFINTNASDALMEKIRKDTVNLHCAWMIAHLPKEEQETFLSRFDDNDEIESAAIKALFTEKEEKEKEKSAARATSENEVPFEEGDGTPEDSEDIEGTYGDDEGTNEETSEGHLLCSGALNDEVSGFNSAYGFPDADSYSEDMSEHSAADSESTRRSITTGGGSGQTFAHASASYDDRRPGFQDSRSRRQESHTEPHTGFTRNEVEELYERYKEICEEDDDQVNLIIREALACLLLSLTKR